MEFDISTDIDILENTAVIIALVDDTSGQVVNLDCMEYADYNKEVDSISEVYASDSFSTAARGNQLVITAREPGKVQIYDLTGACCRLLIWQLAKTSLNAVAL